MDDVVIYGAGGLGCLVQDILLQRATNRPVAFLDSNPAKHGQIVMGLPVRGGTERIERLRDEGVTGVIVAIGDSVTRVALAETLATRGLRLISAIHPSASIAPSAALGEHLIIGARVTICVHARIGAHSVLSAGSIAEHDNQVGRGVFLGPAVRLAGTVTVEDFATLGIGASVIPGRRGPWCTGPSRSGRNSRRPARRNRRRHSGDQYRGSIPVEIANGHADHAIWSGIHLACVSGAARSRGGA